VSNVNGFIRPHILGWYLFSFGLTHRKFLNDTP
jgi:hypothetical protein